MGDIRAPGNPWERITRSLLTTRQRRAFMRGMISLPLTVIESDAELAGVKGKQAQSLYCEDLGIPLQASWIRPEGKSAVPVVVVLEQGEGEPSEVNALLNDLACLGFIALHLQYDPTQLKRSLHDDLQILQCWLRQFTGCVHCNGRIALIAGDQSVKLTNRLAALLEPDALIVPRAEEQASGQAAGTLPTLEVSLPLRSGRRSPQQYQGWPGPLQAVIPDLFHADQDAGDPAQWASVLAFLHCHLD